MPEDRKRMVGPEEAESLYSIPKGTLANWRWAKKGPKFFKVGHKVLYKLDDLEDFFTSNPVLTVDSLPEGQR